MTHKQQKSVAGQIESAVCPQHGRLSPRNWKAMTWFLDFIDHADAPDEVNAYCEMLDENKLTLLKPTT